MQNIPPRASRALTEAQKAPYQGAEGAELKDFEEHIAAHGGLRQEPTPPTPHPWEALRPPRDVKVADPTTHTPVRRYVPPRDVKRADPPPPPGCCYVPPGPVTPTGPQGPQAYRIHRHGHQRRSPRRRKPRTSALKG